MAGTLSTISLISFVASGLFAVLTIVLWFLFRIPAVIGDLSGRTAKKSIELMRRNNEKTGDKSHKPSAVNVGRGKLTNQMADGGTGKDAGQPYETGLLKENMAAGYHSSGTEVLADENATAKLQDGNETVLLEEGAVRPVRKAPTVKIVLLEEIVHIHTEEVI